MTGTTVNTPGALTLNADKLILGTQTTQVDTSNTSQGGDWAWQKAKGEGSSNQTTNYNQFNVGTLVTPVQSVQIGLGARDSVESLAKQPGMSWVSQINSDPKLAGKVDWTKIEEAHSQWDYKQQSLTPAAAAVITLVVAYFTAGAASGLGATAGNAAAVSAGQGVALAGGGAFVSAGAGAAISSVVGGAVTAGVAALAGQAAVAMINNRGDIGGALNDLGSSSNVHGLLTAIATGGVLGGLNLNPTGLPTEGSGAQKFMNQLGQNLQAGAARAVIGTAINGGSLEDSLKNNLKTALLDTMAAQSANAIGDITAGDGTLDEFTNKVAHAIAGCAVGAARTDTSGGCGAGAIGAAIGEMAAEAYGKKSDTTQFAAMVAGIAAATTGASTEEVNLAGQAGGNAAANNYLNHGELAKKQQQLAECKDDSCRKQVNSYWAQASQDRNTKTGDSILAGSEAANLQTMDKLASEMSNLAQYKSGFESQLSSTSDPNQRASLQLQINEADSNMRQIASQGKDALALLYQQTGNPEYQNAFQALIVAISGNEIAGALTLPGGAGGNLGRNVEGAKGGVGVKRGVVADEAAALGRIGGNANGPVLNGKTPNTVLNQQAVNDLANGSLPGITKNPNTGLPDVVPRTGVPREMPASPNPSETAEDFAIRLLGGASTPVNAKPIPNCNGCWSATNEDGVSVTYRPASTASGRTANTTASVDINFKPTGNAINGGEIVKLKFPQKVGQ